LLSPISLRLAPVLSPRQSILLAAQVAEALHQLHRAGFLHLDVKPQNILFKQGCQWRHAVLTDFGSARPINKPVQSGATLNKMLGTGKYLFKAPEQLLGDAAFYGPQADAFGLGATLFWMLFRSAPFTNLVVEPAAARTAFDDEYLRVVRAIHSSDFIAPVRQLLCALFNPHAEARTLDLGQAAEKLTELAPLQPS
jgi:serine/threonine protein kinase